MEPERRIGIEQVRDELDAAIVRAVALEVRQPASGRLDRRGRELECGSGHGVGMVEEGPGE